MWSLLAAEAQEVRSLFPEWVSWNELRKKVPLTIGNDVPERRS